MSVGGEHAAFAWPRERPAWMQRALDVAAQQPPDYFRRFSPPGEPERRSAVLILVGPHGDGEDVVLTQRPWTMRSHAGQVAFPGGGVDPTDPSLAAAALREGEEEVGLRRSTVDVVGDFPGLYMTPSRNAVTPVLGWWREPHPLHVASPDEVETVVRVPLAELLDPANRFTVAHESGYRGPGFTAGGLYVWGFTAMILSEVFEMAGLTEPWDVADERPLPPRMAATAMRFRRG